MELKGYPFELSGKLSCSPEEAFELFGYRMKPGASGVVFYRRRGKVYIGSLVKGRYDNYYNIIQRAKIGVLSKIGSKYLDDLIRPVWGGEHPYNNFIQENMKRIGVPPRWEDMLITRGDLPVPEILYAKSRLSKVFVEIKERGIPLGFGVLELKGLELYHYGPRLYSDFRIVLDFSFRLPPCILFAYYREGDNFSDSVSVRLNKRGAVGKFWMGGRVRKLLSLGENKLWSMKPLIGEIGGRNGKM